MFSRIQTRHFRSLKAVDQSLGPMHALVGPNASGKATFLDVIGENGKPERPKEALEAMISVHRLPRSSALYQKITGRISLARCADPAFSRLRATLQAWFPPPR